MIRRTAAWAIFALVVAACDEVDDPIDANNDPVAVIDAEDSGERGLTVELDGSASHDPDGDALTYAWSITSRPAGSTAAIVGPNQETASFVPDRVGSYTVQLTVSDGDADDSETTTISIDVQSLGSISADSVLVNTNSPAGEFDYRVPANATVVIGSDFTIEPGVSIRMGAGSSIHVTNGGSIHAVGTAALPIAFVGQNASPGYWYGFEIDSNNSLNEFAYVEVAHGGPAGYANVYLDGTLRASNSTFRGAETYGVLATEGAQLPGFANNHFDDNGEGALHIPTSLIGSLDAASDYAGSSAGVVVVSGGTVSGMHTWQAINTAYRVEDNGNLVIAGNVTVQPGAEFVMGEGSYVHVPTGGSLSAVGTASDSIRFVGANDIAGHWYGFEIDSNSSSNRFSHVVVANAGISGYAGLWLDGTLRIDHSHFRRNGEFGLHASENSALPNFSHNRFTLNVEGPIEMPVSLMGALDTATVYHGNSVDRIAVNGGSSSTAQTWRRTSVPFHLLPNATAVLNSAVTVAPGFRMLMGEASFIHVPTGGSISAVGTAADSISFQGASATPGYWYGFEIDSNAANTFSYTRIGHGGITGYANIWVDGTVHASNSHIHDSGTYGVEVGSLGTYVATNVTYSGNAQGNVHTN